MQLFTAQLAHMKLMAWLSLITVYVAIWNEWHWLWGILLLSWGMTNLLQEQTWISESVNLQKNPVLYHLIIITWLISAFYLLIETSHQLLDKNCLDKPFLSLNVSNSLIYCQRHIFIN